MFDISKNGVSPSVTIFEPGTHVERARSVLYVHKCAKMVEKITKLSFCTEEIPVLIQGQNFSSIRYLEPITKILYRNYTIAASNRLFPNVVKLEDDSFQQYGETLKKFDHKIYQWPMNNDLNFSDQNLHRSLFSTSNLKSAESLEPFATIVKELSVEKRSETRMENTILTILYIGTTSFNKKCFSKGNNEFL